MIDRRSVLTAGLTLAGGLALSGRVLAQTSPQDQADLTRIEAYLNGIRTLRARFVQTAPDGDVTQGLALLQRPGRMRFQYDPPSPFLLIANAGTLFFHDAQLRQTTNIPLSRTPLGILLADRASLSGEVTVTRFARLTGQIQVCLARTASPGEGTLTLIFTDSPMTLRQWVVLDQQGKQTRVTLTNLEPGVAIDAKQFDYHALPSTGGG